MKITRKPKGDLSYLNFITTDGCIIMVGNFDVDVRHQQRIGPPPLEMRNDTPDTLRGLKMPHLLTAF